MRYCIYCGSQLDDDAQFCTNCGKPVNAAQAQAQAQKQAAQVAQQKDNQVMKVFISVLLIISCVVQGIFTFGIALSWCIPMTVTIRKRMREGVPVGVAMSVCTLIFVNTIAGILLLCLGEESK